MQYIVYHTKNSSGKCIEIQLFQFVISNQNKYCYDVMSQHANANCSLEINAWQIPRCCYC